MPENDRELHVAVRDPSGRRLLVAGDPPRLPTLTVTLAPDQTTVAAAASQLRDAWHITAPLLEVQFDYDADPESGPIPTLVVTEPAAVHPPTELRWHDLDLGEPAIHPALEPRLRELVEEWRTGAEPPDLRPRWARPGWHARATRWLTARLTALGRPPTGPVEQVRHWSISAVLRAPTDAGAVWMKAVFPPFTTSLR